MCRPQLFVLVLAAMLGAAFTDEEETSARLLVAKMIMNKYLVEDMDIIVKYSLYNIGNSAALAVEINDNSFNPDAFDVVGGQLRVSLDRIPPGANVSHVVVVRPRKYGYFNFTSAQVSYLPSEDATERQLAITSEPGEGVIVAFRDYDRKFSPHVLDWAAFAVMTLPSLGIPFLLWYSSKSKYETIVKHKKDKSRNKDD
ncbi:translocon-associated protein subunit beta [Ischnura elegans]|uniref:translocon-associated protein subunit beta n=1 Tax=Ischnura elegans TaxID=197161 RepID=UPI001ED89915|nr:translocon-associated protein subunit beta [Ischnura elegans]